MATTADGALVEAARAGDQRAFGQLFDEWFDRVHDVSRRIVHDDGIAAEVAQDCFLTAWRKLDTLQDVDAFGGWILRIGRNRSLNRLAKERRSTATDDQTMTAVLDASAPDEDPLARLDQAGRIALVWDAAAALGERDASVLDLHLRHGLGAAELAEELGTNPNNAHQILFTLRKRLGNAVRALVLWRAGRPTCADLRQGLAAAGLTSFGAPMVKAIDRHVDGCATCSADRTERLDPAMLFAAAPIVGAGVLVKSSAASALAEAGVPMSGSAALGGAGTGAASSTGSGPDPSSTSSGGATEPPTDTSVAGEGSGVVGGATEPTDPLVGETREASGRSGGVSRRQLAVVVALVVALGVGLALWFADDADEPTSVVAAGTTSEPAGPSTTDAPPTTTGERSSGTTSGSTTPATGGTAPTVPRSGTAPPTSAPPGSEAPATGAPPVTGATPPVTAPPVTAPPATAPPGTVTTPPTDPAPTTTVPPPAPPVIDRFDASITSATGCRGGVRWSLVWATTGADAVRVGLTGEAGADQPVDGKTSVCALRTATFDLVADGPGGSTTATAPDRRAPGTISGAGGAGSLGG